MQGQTRIGVPEADVSIRRATPRGHQAVLVGRPGHSLDGRSVILKATERLCWATLLCLPDEELVVVAARGEHLVVEGPLQTAHLLAVRRELPNNRWIAATAIAGMTNGVSVIVAEETAAGQRQTGFPKAPRKAAKGGPGRRCGGRGRRHENTCALRSTPTCIKVVAENTEAAVTVIRAENGRR